MIYETNILINNDPVVATGQVRMCNKAMNYDTDSRKPFKHQGHNCNTHHSEDELCIRKQKPLQSQSTGIFLGDIGFRLYNNIFTSLDILYTYTIL